MKSNNDTRSQILDAAQDMLQRQSISGVSFQELANRIGIKKGSMYYHFQSKDGLSIAILERASSDMLAAFARGAGKSPTQQLAYFINIFRSFMGQAEKICPGGAFAGEWDKLNEPVQVQAHRLIKVQVQGLKKIIEAGLNTGEFSDHHQTSEALADWAVSNIQGALLTSRITQNHLSFETSMDILMQYLTEQ
ncbi:MAG: TetR/AcrR family transcriptional regulator [Bermanella sp.]